MNVLYVADVQFHNLNQLFVLALLLFLLGFLGIKEILPDNNSKI